MMLSGNRKILRPLFTGLSAALCIASFFAWDARNSASLAQERCDGASVRRNWVEKHEEVRRARQALREMIAAFHDKYTDSDFGRAGTRQRFSDALDVANKRFDELITGAAYNSAAPCHVCQLLASYERPGPIDQAEPLTMQEVEQFPDWFDTLAEDRDLVERIERRDDRSRLEDARFNLHHDTDEFVKRLRDFRGSHEWNPSSPKMSGLRSNFICERMQP